MKGLYINELEIQNKCFGRDGGGGGCYCTESACHVMSFWYYVKACALRTAEAEEEEDKGFPFPSFGF